MSTVLPPRERVDLNDAKDKWVSFWNGSLSLHAMFQLYGNKICMVVLERFDHMPLLVSKLQRDLLEMRQPTMSNVCAPDWKFGLLCNAAKFPLDSALHSETD